MKSKATVGIMLTLLLVGILTLAVNFQPVKADPEARVYVDPPACGRGPSEEIAVQIEVANVEFLYSWRFDLEWNSSLLEIPDDPETLGIVEGVSEGTFLNKEGEFQTTFVQRLFADDGRVSVTCALQGVAVNEAPSGSGTLATVTFKVKAEGECPLHFNLTRLLRPTSIKDPTPILISHTAEDGYFSTAFPAVIFNFLPEEPLAGDPVTFNASDSYDYDGYIANYTWDFGDGNITVVSDAVLVHVYASRGLYNVNLTLTDNDGNSCSATKLVIARSEICVPDDYQTVQEAIDAAISRDTIFVRNGTYREDVEINKSVSLLGEERTATLIDGTVLITESKVVLSGFTVQGSLRIGDSDRATKNVTVNRNIVSNGGILMFAPASLLPNYPLSPVLTNNTVSNNFITNSTHGISLQGWGTNNTVSGNIATNNEAGIVLRGHGNNTIVNNVVSGNVFGMWLESRNNMLRNNTMTDNQYNFVTDTYHLWGTAPVNNVDTSNTVNGKPVYLLINKSDMFIDPSSFPDVGYLALINCYNVTVRNLRLTNNSQGILISNSANIIIAGNTLKNNMIALTVKNVNDTSFENNTIIDNLHGVFFSSGFNNTIIDNTLSNNTIRLLPYRWPERWPLPPLSTWIRELIWYSGGIFFYDCSNNTIANNILLNNERGIYFSASSLNIFKNNTMVGNLHNFGIESWILIPQEWGINPPSKPQISPFLLNQIDTSNTVNGKPIYYWINRNGEQVPSDAGYVVLINSTNMIAKDLTLQNNEQGILLFDTTNTTISNSIIAETRYGIQVKSFYYNDVPLNNTFSQNNIINNGAGISLDSDGNKVSRNVLKLNLAGVYARSDHNLITENVVINNTLPPEEEWILGYEPPNTERLVFAYALGPAGILLEASNNIVCYNTIQDNEYGMSIGLLSCNGDNIIHHNNFINNTMHGLVGTINTWEGGYPSGGNYWSDYEGVDAYNGPYQNETGSDGIGDTVYFVGKWVNLVRACSPEALNQWDQYPLMAPVSLFDAGTWNSVPYNVHVVSNSTISGFHFDPQEGAFLRFNVTGRNGTTGFCRVTIPKDLLWVKDGWIVTVNDSPVDYTIVSDQNHTYMCFNYTHSTKTVKITGTHVIPEFQSLLIIPLFMIATLLTVIAGRKHSNGKEYS